MKSFKLFHIFWVPKPQPHFHPLYFLIFFYIKVLDTWNLFVHKNCRLFFWVFYSLIGNCLTSCSSLVRALVCQTRGPGPIPGMSHSETAITRGNPIMLLPPTTFRVLHAYVLTCLQDSWPMIVSVLIRTLTQRLHVRIPWWQSLAKNPASRWAHK